VLVLLVTEIEINTKHVESLKMLYLDAGSIPASSTKGFLQKRPISLEMGLFLF